MNKETAICHKIDKTARYDNTRQAIYDPFLKNTLNLKTAPVKYLKYHAPQVLRMSGPGRGWSHG